MTEATSGRYCKSCRYDLRGSVEPVCPECGQMYDPNNPETYLQMPTARVPTILRALEILAIAYPMVIVLVPKACYLQGRMQLGYWPRPSLDDPNTIGIDVVYIVALLLISPLILFLPGSLIVAGVSIAYRSKSYPLRFRSLPIGIFIIFVWLVLYIDMRVDPWSIWSWFWD